jgi:hypothetical protein
LANNIASQHDDIMAGSRNALRNIRSVPFIGSKQRELQRGHLRGKLGRLALAVGGVIVGAGIIGTIINGIGFSGVMLTALLIGAAAILLLRYPRMTLPTPETLQKTDLATLAGKTEIWLAAQCPALPAPAVSLVQDIGLRLDQLSPQLASLGEFDPAAMEVRKLVGEHLPELINGYKRIPDTLKRKEHSGKTPEQQLVDGLKLIDREIDTMTGQISRGELDKLAVRGRYLELKYDGAGEA